AVWGGMERTRSALSTGVGSVAGSRMGRLLATGMDAVLGKSEELVERYLPGTDEELELALCHGRGDRRGHLAFLVTPPHDPAAEHPAARHPNVPMTGCRAWCVSGMGGVAHPSASGGMLQCPMVQPRGSRPAAAAAGGEVASAERQRRWQSYFVRVGSLSAKLRHRALRR
ncbi:PLIN3 protein, partial [Pluvianellus socialis]|nr:PLIN3 protein [Pluvianellus socialis]